MSGISVPTRDSLIDSLRRANRATLLSLPLQAILVLLLAGYAIDWSLVKSEPFMSVVVAFIMIGPTLFGLARLAAQNKKEITKLRDGAKIGNFTKPELIALARDVERTLGIGKSRVFITGEKDLNAAAIQVGLGSIFPSLNAIYLNRAALHCLNRDEMATVIGHELAHVARHYLLWDKLLFLRMVGFILIGLYARQYFHGNDTFEVMGPVFIGGALQFLSGMYRGRFAHTLEYLCDDAGAVVAGIVPAIRAELKIAARSEAYQSLFRRALRQKLDSGSFSLKELQKTLEEALPYGGIDEAQLQKELDRRFAENKRAKETFSLKGFLQFLDIYESIETREKLRQQLDGLEALVTLPRLDIPPTLPNDGTLADFDHLVKQIEAEPNKVLFHLEGEIEDMSSSHPGARKRIVYLYRNREAIERERGKQLAMRGTRSNP